MPLTNFLCMLFRLCETSFANFCYVYKGSPSNFYILQQNWCLKNPRCSPLLHFFGTIWLVGDFKKTRKKIRKFFLHSGTVEDNTWHFEVLLLFLSFRYGADWGRSWLVVTRNTYFETKFFQRWIFRQVRKFHLGGLEGSPNEVFSRLKNLCTVLR